jgi:hypothetical protein
VVLAGIVAGQAVLYGPSLIGRKVLLPLDILAQPGIYDPIPPGVRPPRPHDPVLSDLVLGLEPARRFAAAEIRAGRWPMWMPFQYAGCPYLAPKYSPFCLLGYAIGSPLGVAWSQVLLALVAGGGAFLFCRRALGVGFWPAAIVAWGYPLSGFFVLWQGSHLPGGVAWLPWILLAVDRAVRRPAFWSGPALAAVTGLVILSGSPDVGGQVLLISGIYAVWCFIDRYGRQALSPPAVSAMGILVLGWGLGIALAAVQMLPLVQYTRTGLRMFTRSVGTEERPPIGLAALPQAILPDMYGSTQRGSLPMFPRGQGNQLESSAAAYAGLLAALLAAPLAWCSRRHRSQNVLWVVLCVVGLGWTLNIPGLVHLLRLPVLNMMSHNRLVFATSLGILAMAAVGLEVLGRRRVRRSRWFWLPMAALAALAAWCIYRSVVLPAPLAAHAEVQPSFVQFYRVAAGLALLGLAGWLLLWFRVRARPWAATVLGLLLVGDLLWFAYGRSTQCEPSLYYPRIPVLEELAAAPPGRIIGYHCLPANLAQTQHLRDIRGYDGVDPAQLVHLLVLAADPQRSRSISYAVTQWLVPKIDWKVPKGVRLPPILDMLNVRYVVFRGRPPKEVRPDFSGLDYWVMTNRNAMPRAYVPERVETAAEFQQRLDALASPKFDPRKVAYVESPVELPAACRGSAEIVQEIPTRVTVEVDMQTAGLVVLSDLWEAGWKAYLDDRPLPILRTNHAVRGVVLPAGHGVLEFRYEPASFRAGLRISALAGLAALLWLGSGGWIARRGALRPDRS